MPIASAYRGEKTTDGNKINQNLFNQSDHPDGNIFLAPGIQIKIAWTLVKVHMGTVKEE